MNVCQQALYWKPNWSGYLSLLTWLWSSAHAKLIIEKKVKGLSLKPKPIHVDEIALIIASHCHNVPESTIANKSVFITFNIQIFKCCFERIFTCFFICMTQNHKKSHPSSYMIISGSLNVLKVKAVLAFGILCFLFLVK